MPQKLFYALYKKTNKHILQTRTEMSDNANPLILEFWVNDFCENQGFNANEYAGTLLSLPIPKEGGHEMYLYDEATNSLVIDPNWIEPPRVETSSIPISGG